MQLRLLLIATIVIALVLLLPYLGIHLATTPPTATTTKPASTSSSTVTDYRNATSAKRAAGKQQAPHTAGYNGDSRYWERQLAPGPSPTPDRLSEIEDLLK